jgi:hypothetical protein
MKLLLLDANVLLSSPGQTVRSINARSPVLRDANAADGPPAC